MKKAEASTPIHRLRQAREERGWSQRELADRIGTTSVNISRWENGSTVPSPHFRQQLRDVFEKTLADLGLLPSPHNASTPPPEPDVSPSPHNTSMTLPKPDVLPLSGAGIALPASDAVPLPHDANTALPEDDAVPSPHGFRIGNIPIVRNPYFTGRIQLLALLHERLSIARTAALTQPQALFGLGGIGKTQTAAEYAFRYGNDYAHVFWMRAATRETLVADFVSLAKLLNLPEKDEQDQPRIIAAVKHWLAAHESWLLILDNADDLPLAQEFLPGNHQGYVLFTTRDQASGAIAASVEVEKLTLQEGTLLLLRWTKLLDKDTPLEQARTEDRATAEHIVREMDGLPLAIVQAGAYIEETGCSLTDYLSFYVTHRKDLLARRGRLFLDYPETVATTWSLSFQQIERESPAAANVLRLCAFLAPDAIPEELFTRGSAELGTALGVEALDPFKLNEALEVLRRYSLVRRNAGIHVLSIHRLVQVVLKESMDQQTQRAWAEHTVRAVNAAFPEVNYSSGTNHQHYLPHVQECATLITQYQLHFPEAARLLYRAGAFLYFHGFYPQSQSLHQQALAIREQVFGSDHPAVAESLNALAVLARLQGNYKQAEQFHRQALAIREKALGLEHFATVLSLNNLGVLYRTQGKYEQAEPLLQQGTLSIREQSLGSQHPETLMTFNNLAQLYLEQHKYEQAEQLLQEALAISEPIVGTEHPLIAHNLNLLARLSYEQGNHERAETLWKRSLAIIEKTLGPEHPVTAERLNDLAELAYARGRFTQAESLCQKALNICEKILGSEHPDTIAVRKHLNNILSKRVEAQDDGNHHPAPH